MYAKVKTLTHLEKSCIANVMLLAYNIEKPPSKIKDKRRSIRGLGLNINNFLFHNNIKPTRFIIPNKNHCSPIRSIVPDWGITGIEKIANTNIKEIIFKYLSIK
jgi:hypothetical protein